MFLDLVLVAGGNSVMDSDKLQIDRLPEMDDPSLGYHSMDLGPNFAMVDDRKSFQK